MARNVRLEWRQGSTGLGSVYVFSPKPAITREESALKQAEFNIPLGDGVQIQNLGREKRIINLSGTLIAKSGVFEDLEDLKDALVNGIGRTEGQLHFISLNTGLVNARHLFYKGQISPEGVRFSEQTRPNIIDYSIQIICADPNAYNFKSETITSLATVV